MARTRIRVSLTDKNKPKTFLAAVASGIERQSRNVHIQKMNEVAAKSQQLFKARLGPPYAKRNRPSVSGTRGGRVYRSHRRGSGNFTFGSATSGAAFHGSLIKEGGKTGFGFPNIKDADRKTRGAWRALEFGLTRAQHRMPRHIWKNAAGSVGKANFTAGTEFAPIDKTPSLRGPGIRQKKFIKDAWEDVMRSMPKAYEEMIVKEFRYRSGRPSGLSG